MRALHMHIVVEAKPPTLTSAGEVHCRAGRAEGRSVTRNFKRNWRGVPYHSALTRERCRGVVLAMRVHACMHASALTISRRLMSAAACGTCVATSVNVRRLSEGCSPAPCCGLHGACVPGKVGW